VLAVAVLVLLVQILALAIKAVQVERVLILGLLGYQLPV
jgi:hypothetical protein